MLFSQVLVEILMHFIQDYQPAKEVSWRWRTVAGTLIWLHRGKIWKIWSVIVFF
jgi:hypothetical protein